MDVSVKPRPPHHAYHCLYHFKSRVMTANKNTDRHPILPYYVILICDRHPISFEARTG